MIDRAHALEFVCGGLGISPVGFLSMDVHRAEASILRGLKRALRRTKHLYTEYSDRESHAGSPSQSKIVVLTRSFRTD